MLLCSDTTLEPIEIVRLYALRFKIEFMFKQAAHVIGGYDYHFQMREMRRTVRGEGNRLIAGESKEYRAAGRRRLHAYHVFLSMGVIAQGLMHYLAACHTEAVWASFGSWMRTVRDRVAPSEFVVTTALWNTLPEFLAVGAGTSVLAKFIVARQHREPAVAWPAAAQEKWSFTRYNRESLNWHHFKRFSRLVVLAGSAPPFPFCSRHGSVPRAEGVRLVRSSIRGDRSPPR